MSDLVVQPNIQPDQMAVRRKNAARLSVFSNFILIVLKLAVGLSIGSVSVMSEAIHSSVDLVAAIMAFVAVRIAARPADHGHPYGHGKFENLSGLLESLLIYVGAALIVYEAVDKLANPIASNSTNVLWGAAVMAISAIVNFGVSRYLMRVAKETDSVALKADAVHLQADVITSLGVFVGLALVWLTGWHALDALTALAVAFLIIKSGWDIMLYSVGGLVDASLPDDEEKRIIAVIEQFAAQYVNFHYLQTRQAGPERHIDFHLVVPDQMRVEQAHQLCDRLEAAIKGVVNGAIVQIHVEPASVWIDVDGVYQCSIAIK